MKLLRRKFIMERDKLQLFNNKEIQTAWDEGKEE